MKDFYLKFYFISGLRHTRETQNIFKFLRSQDSSGYLEFFKLTDLGYFF